MHVIPIGSFGNSSKKNDEKSHIHEPTPLRWKSLQREPIFKEKRKSYMKSKPERKHKFKKTQLCLICY
jgi:hypothetical protein